MDAEKERYMKNVKKPQNDKYGEAQLNSMNERHNDLALWGIALLVDKGEKLILDVGCGGGKNIENLLNRKKDVKVYGIDYSKASCDMSFKHNKTACLQGKVEIKAGNAEKIPYDDNMFDLVTAFETIYFWDLDKGFAEVYRVLKEGGRFMIVNESNDPKELEEVIKIVGFKVYTIPEIVESMEKAGFKNIISKKHDNGKWITVICEK